MVRTRVDRSTWPWTQAASSPATSERRQPGRQTRKCPEEPSIFHRVPQSKLQRSQGFSPSAPSGKINYDRRTSPLATGLSTTFALPTPDSRGFSTGHPRSAARRALRSPCPAATSQRRRPDPSSSSLRAGPGDRRTGRRDRPTMHRLASRTNVLGDGRDRQARKPRTPRTARDRDPRTERQTAEHNETPEGTNRSAGPFPPMQAPATRFLRTPVRSRRRRCKHLRRRFRSVMAPSGKSNDTGARVALAMGLSTNLAAEPLIRSALSTVRPRTRPIGACGAAGLSAPAARRAGPAGRPGRRHRGAPRGPREPQGWTDPVPARTRVATAALRPG